MNKIILSLSILAIIAAISLYVAQPESKGQRIALLLPAIHPAMDEIERAFRETMAKGKQLYTINTFNACGNKTVLRAQAEEIAHNSYDLAFTVGTLCSHMMHTLKTQKQIAVPLIFCAVDDPASIGITQEARAQGDQTTGVYISDNFDAQCTYLKKVMPYARSLLFVYDPTHGTSMQKTVDHITNAAQKVGITVNLAQVFASNEISQKVEPLLSATDVALIYTDHTTVSAADALIKLCNQYKVPLYASDLNTGYKGAALAFGVQEYEHGKQSALKALSILDDYALPQNIAITPVDNYKLLLNKSAMSKQGLSVSNEQLSNLAQDERIIIKDDHD